MQDIYLSNIELDDAIKIYFERLGNLKEVQDEINSSEANGRVTSEAVYAKISCPSFNSSAMDGIATLSAKTNMASDRNHISLIENEDYIVVDTGDPIPNEMDCVIMVEDLIRVDQKTVKIYKSAVPWQNIRPLGEDIVEKQLIIPSNHKIRPVDIGAMIAGGVNRVLVTRKPIVGIIPTGTEIVEPGSVMKVGDIIDFNSSVFSVQVEMWGGEARKYPIVKDIYKDIKCMVQKAVQECDIVLINAGSSAGREDYTSAIIAECGEVIVHGIAIKPGKPAIFGIINKKPVLGIPGYPVSAYFIMERVVKKVVEKYLKIEISEYKTVEAYLSRRVMSSLKYLEFVRVKLGFIGERFIATPLSRGAGASMSLVRADGVLEITQNVEGIEAGSKVLIQLLNQLEDIKNTIVCIGSHDPIIDIISDMLHIKCPNYYLSSAHTGSMGGIMALKNNETHISPIHLLDMETGVYNESFIKKYLPKRDIALIKCVKRIQGIMVKKENPLNIKSFEDLVIKKPRFVNRQRGSGTRLLLDYNIKKNNINPKDINGYEREEFTHLSVAAAVLSDSADCALGIYSAAIMMGLDFIPICSEEYDIALPYEYLKLNMIDKLIELFKSKEFLYKLEKLGGYEYSDIGKILRIGD